MSQTVEVTGEAPLVETTNANIASLVDERTVWDLPLNGRDLIQLTTLNLGVIALRNASVAVLKMKFLKVRRVR